jgi:nitrogen fixation-related uncharacterized protein
MQNLKAVAVAMGTVAAIAFFWSSVPNPAIQNLKAVTMGMVTAIALFWSNKPNPAMYT